jgi:hypothetical protein
MVLLGEARRRDVESRDGGGVDGAPSTEAVTRSEID